MGGPESGKAGLPRLVPTADQDLKELISWIPDKASCKLWAGPVVRFPLSPETLKKDMGCRPGNTFSLVNAQGALLGIGQVLKKPDNRIHLARIIVSPTHRGHGFGANLCRSLMAAGKKKYGESDFSLNVYAENGRARNLYVKLGFRQHPPPAEFAADPSIVYMLKACRNKRISNDERQC